MNNRFLGIVFVLALAGGSAQAKDSVKPKGPEEDGTKPALTSVAGEGFYDSHAYAYLTELSDDVGARVTGSPSAQKAIDWGAAKMTSMGLVNVRPGKMVHVERLDARHRLRRIARAPAPHPDGRRHGLDRFHARSGRRSRSCHRKSFRYGYGTRQHARASAEKSC